MTGKWGGASAKRYREQVFARYGRVCWLNYPGRCTVEATQADHVLPRSERPDLQFVVTNGRPACGPCNRHKRTKRAPAPKRVDDRDWFLQNRRPHHPTEPSGEPGESGG